MHDEDATPHPSLCAIQDVKVIGEYVTYTSTIAHMALFTGEK